MPAPVILDPPSTDSAYAHLRTGRSVAAFKGVIWSAVNSIVPAAIGALVFVITSRVLSAAEFGVVAFAMGIGSLFGVLAPTGFGDALVQRSNIDERHLSSVFWMCCIFAALVFGVTCLVAIPVAAYADEPMLRYLLPVAGTKIVFDIVGVVPTALLTRSMSFGLVALRTTIASIIAAVICLTLLWLGYGIWALAISQVSATAASCVGAIMASKWRPTRWIDRNALRELARYGLFSSGTRMLQLVYSDQVLVGALAGTQALGFFNFARRIFQIFNDIIAGAMSSVAHSLMSSLQTETEKLRAAFYDVSFISASVSFALFGGLAAIAPDVIPVVFGTQWIAATVPLQAFCVIGLISSIGFLQGSLINSQGNADWWFWYQAIKQVALLAAILISYRYGVSAIAVAMVTVSVLVWPASIIKSARVLQVRSVDYLKQFLTPATACAVMVCAIALARPLLSEQDATLRLVVNIAGGGTLYLATWLLLSHRRGAAILNRLRNGRRSTS